MRGLFAVLFAVSAFAQAPTITSFTSSAASAAVGTDVTLTWAVSGATSITISPGITGTIGAPYSTSSGSGSQAFTIPATADVKFDGDSITFGLGVTNDPGGFVAPGSPCCAFPPQAILTNAIAGRFIKTWFNAGVSGARATSGTPKTPLPCDAATNQPAIQTVALGSNDLANGVTVSALLNNATTGLIARWQTLLAAGCKVIASTILPRTTIGGTLMDSANTAIKAAVTANPGVFLVDTTLDTTFGCTGCELNSTYWCQSGGCATHPTDAGQTRLASLYAPILAQALAVTYKLTATNGSGSTTATVDVSVMTANSASAQSAGVMHKGAAIHR